MCYRFVWHSKNSIFQVRTVEKNSQREEEAEVEMVGRDDAAAGGMRRSTTGLERYWESLDTCEEN